MFEGVISSEVLKCNSYAAKVVKWSKIEVLVCRDWLKWFKSWAAKGKDMND